MRARRILLGLLTLVCVLGLPWARQAGAQAASVKRSFENITQAPLDLLVAPVTAYQTLDINTEDAVQSKGARVTTRIVGYPFVLWLYGILAGFREAAGIAELPVGLVLWPINAFHKVELTPFFDPSEAHAMLERPGPAYSVTIGGRYLASH